jgi:hypothetical protein
MLTSHPHYIIFVFTSVFWFCSGVRTVRVRRVTNQACFPCPCLGHYRPSLTGMRLLLPAALSTLLPIISSSIRVISSMFLPVVLGGGMKGFGLVGEVDVLVEVDPLVARLTLLFSLRILDEVRRLPGDPSLPTSCAVSLFLRAEVNAAIIRSLSSS